MKWAISNLAWEPSENTAIAQELAEFGVKGLEVVPGKLGLEPLRLEPEELRAWRDFWHARGMQLVAMQSLLFGKPELQVFGDPPATLQTLAYLAKTFVMARQLGIPTLVFGSPKNRARGALSEAEAWRRGVDFFRTLGGLAQKQDVCLCIEANPAQYGCDFIRTSDEAFALVQAVDSPGFGLHLDSAAMHLAGEDLPSQVRRLAPWIRHVHLSAPDLAPVAAEGPIDYRTLIDSLQDVGYAHWISIEMRASLSPGANHSLLRSVLSYVRNLA